MTAATSLVSTLFEAVWAFEAAEEKRCGIRPITEIRRVTTVTETRLTVSVCFYREDAVADVVVDEGDSFEPRAFRKAIAAFQAWRELHDGLIASKTVNAALKRGAGR